MRLVLFTIGVRGDLEPYLALGLALKARGHDVVIASHLEYQTTVRDRGLQFKRLAGNPRLLLEGPQAETHLARSLRNEAIDPRPWLGRMGVAIAANFERLLEDARKAADGAHGIVVTPFLLGLNAIAELFKIPWAVASPVPWARTHAFANPWTRPRGRILHGLSYRVPWGMYFRQLQSATSAFREKHALRPDTATDPDELAHGAQALVDGYTSALAPKPSDVPSALVVTGAFWPEPPPNWTPPTELAAFLDRGAPPLYLRVGRTGDVVAKTFDAVFRSAQRLRQRLLVSGPELTQVPPHRDLLHVPDVPHSWLFPRVSAVIHHGGAGTTAAALRADRPQLIVPVVGDHAFWGERVFEAGVGPRPLEQNKLTGPRLDDALSQLVHDDRMQERARQLGAVTRTEGGAPLAAELISSRFSSYAGRA